MDFDHHPAFGSKARQKEKIYISIYLSAAVGFFITYGFHLIAVGFFSSPRGKHLTMLYQFFLISVSSNNQVLDLTNGALGFDVTCLTICDIQKRYPTSIKVEYITATTKFLN